MKCVGFGKNSSQFPLTGFCPTSRIAAAITFAVVSCPAMKNDTKSELYVVVSITIFKKYCNTYLPKKFSNVQQICKK
ncbi:hypothetical protein BpHYR1_046630 [Brachionus plicatilis]|uniref:Uncharacterized protein n=1 Tax=Brachionus plicatilis TaxID=10195 RepID=A0A3M7Q729_BRAPC|nr:hypothetical protein BpHYR1_046630 [Brachionus plicatilis]